MKFWHLFAVLALGYILSVILPPPHPSKPPFFTTY